MTGHREAGGTAGGSTFGLMPRRLQKFKIKPNEKLKWTAVTVARRAGTVVYFSYQQAGFWGPGSEGAHG